MSDGSPPWDPGGPRRQPPPPPPPPQQPYGQQPYGQQPYRQPLPYAPQPQVVYVAPSRPTNGLAIASMVLGILWLYWVGSILAVIFGHIALSQIKRKNQSGRGMAIAGLVLGYIGVAILAVVIIAVVAAANSDSNY